MAQGKKGLKVQKMFPLMFPRVVANTMRALCWDVRGLGNPRTFHDLQQVIHLLPNFVFLSETKRNSYQVEIIRVKLNYDFCFSVGCSSLVGD